jgi:hypothetical protein
MPLSEGEQEILLELVETASEQLSNNGCNDFDLSRYLSKAEIFALVLEYHVFNGDSATFDADRDGLDVPDFALISFLTKKSLGLIK